MGRGMPAAPPPMAGPVPGLAGPVRGVGGPAPGVSGDVKKSMMYIDSIQIDDAT